ncbi:hypothetical protein WKI65_07330 [Streptomyces sp. MS1.AVA.3]|uniref:hypothetical protein n=1 Tax=Streptomyces decoyicus TaxID=249567 RepID=UPI0030C08020
MPAHGGLHGGLSTAELAPRGGGVRLRVLLRVWVLLLVLVLLGVRVRGLGRVSRLRVIRAGRLVRVGTRRLVRVGTRLLVRSGTGGLLRVGPRGRLGVRVRAVRWWRGGHRDPPESRGERRTRWRTGPD